MKGLVKPIIEQKLLSFLEEDTHAWDLSSKLVPSKEVSATLKVKTSGILAGAEVFTLLFKMLDVETHFHLDDGDQLQPQDSVAQLTGISDNILIGERLGLNLLSRMSGIATLTNQYVKSIEGVKSETKIAGTRKTLPGLRLFDKLAIQIGGGDTHRFSLQDCIMLKDNHLKMFDSVKLAIRTAKEQTSFSHKIEVECKTLDMAKEAIKCGADIIMLDNFSVEKAKTAITELRKCASTKNIIFELSGNITKENIAKYAQVGADIISSGAITHSVKAADFSLGID